MHIRTSSGYVCLYFAVFVVCCLPVVAQATRPNVKEIIQKSVEANRRDFQAAPYYNNKERDKDGSGTKTYQVTMIAGTPYQRLIEVNGQPLAEAQKQQELKKERDVTAQRCAESADQSRQRIEKYTEEQKRDTDMISELTKAFEFQLAGTHKLRGFTVWLLKATPLPGYKPPNRNAQVLTGMNGQLWIDQKTYQWVRVTARVIQPVSIYGFMAQVEPGTRFEMDKMPVGKGIWQISHFSEHAEAKVLHLFSHNEAQDSTYFDYQRIDNPDQNGCSSR
ncbi:MAG: hypothetical protein JO033_29460 [Acidobacteriaceae bacterium]|nr:hypothetical protein [Acidobacteriaceae bacterium]